MNLNHAYVKPSVSIQSGASELIPVDTVHETDNDLKVFILNIVKQLLLPASTGCRNVTRHLKSFCIINQLYKHTI
jgi:hypothetical protein